MHVDWMRTHADELLHQGNHLSSQPLLFWCVLSLVMPAAAGREILQTLANPTHLV
jgi:hypothetical protein